MLPDGIEDRAADCWEPLVAVADLAEGMWPTWVLAAAVELNKLRVERAPSLSEQLLADCVASSTRSARTASRAPTWPSRCCGLDDAPWADLRGSMLDARGLARRLRPFGVRPDSHRFDDKILKGYLREQFVDAWDRYSPLPTLQKPEQPEQAEQDQNGDVPVVPDVPHVPVSDGMGEALAPNLFDGYVPAEGGAVSVRGRDRHTVTRTGARVRASVEDRGWGECRRCRQTVPIWEGYMVHDDVWLPPYEGVLHVACLEAELGRQLTPADFTDCLLNLFPLREPVQRQLPLGDDARLVLAQRISGREEPWITRDSYLALAAACRDRFAAAQSARRVTP